MMARLRYIGFESVSFKSAVLCYSHVCKPSATKFSPRSFAPAGVGHATSYVVLDIRDVSVKTGAHVLAVQAVQGQSYDRNEVHDADHQQYNVDLSRPCEHGVLP